MRDLIEYRNHLRATHYPHPAKAWIREGCRLIGCGLIAYILYVEAVIFFGVTQ